VQALVCRAFGPPECLRLEELPRPVPGPGQVLVAVHAIGVNYTDVLAIEGRSQLKRQFPMIPGVEAAGVVFATGPQVMRLRVGQRVLGTKLSGAFAEEALFEEGELAVIPDAMDMHSAAAFYISSMTADYALRGRAKLQSGEILLVLGAGGGLGLAAIEIGKAVGARVVAAASKSRGADTLVRYERGPLDLAQQKAFAANLLAHAGQSAADTQSIGKISSLQDGAGYQVIIDGVGGSYAEPALRALGWQGRYLSVGFAAGMAHVALGPALFKNADIMGIQPSSDENRLPGRNPSRMQRLFDWYVAGKLRPQVTDVFALADAAMALRKLLERRAVGRIILKTSLG
jgi:NADPH:quinone reductase